MVRGLWLVAASGVFFAASTATGKLALSEGASTFQVTSIRGLVMLTVVVAAKGCLWAAGMHPLPVRYWLGTSGRQVRLLLLRALCGVSATLSDEGRIAWRRSCSLTVNTRTCVRVAV